MDQAGESLVKGSFVDSENTPPSIFSPAISCPPSLSLRFTGGGFVV